MLRKYVDSQMERQSNKNNDSVLRNMKQEGLHFTNNVVRQKMACSLRFKRSQYFKCFAAVGTKICRKKGKRKV